MILLCMLLLTPPLGQVLASSKSFQETKLMDLLNPKTTDEQRVNRTEKVDELFQRYMSQEIGQEISDEELASIKSGNYSYHFKQGGSSDLASLTARRKYLSETYQATASLVSSMEVVSSTVVAAASPSDAKLSDQLPYDTMLLLDKQEKLYRKISQTLAKEIKVLEMLKLMVMLKPVFMPKLEVKPPPPHMTICKKYMQPFPPILSQIDWDKLTLDQLAGELEGQFQGYAQGYEDLANNYLEESDEWENRINNFDAETETEGALNGFLKETREGLDSLGEGFTLEDATALCDGNYSKLTGTGLTDLAQLESKRKLACSTAETFQQGMESKQADTELSNCVGCAEGGPYLQKVEHYLQMGKDQVKTFLSMLVQKIQATVKPQS